MREAHATEQCRLSEQRAKDAAEATARAGQDQLDRIAKYKYKEADQHAERDRATALEADLWERTQEEAARLKEQMRVRYLAGPGTTPDDFEKA
jgi:hypothetical protein